MAVMRNFRRCALVFSIAATGCFASHVQARLLQVDPIGYKDQVNLYTYTDNDPLNHRDSTGKRIDLEYHLVVPAWVDSARHFSIRITPDDQQSVKDDPKYNNIDSDGKRYTTLSGYPEPTIGPDRIGTLTKEQNRSTDLGKQEGSLRVKLPDGVSEGKFIDRLQGSFDNYTNGLNYDLFPQTGTDGYNSNSFAVGLLQSAGGTAPDLPQKAFGTLDAPGYDKPVPIKCFDKNNSC